MYNIIMKGQKNLNTGIKVELDFVKNINYKQYRLKIFLKKKPY